MNKARQLVSKIGMKHSMVKRLLAHNVDMVLDMLEALELKKFTLTVDDQETQVVICVENKKQNVCYTITSEGMEWEIVN